MIAYLNGDYLEDSGVCINPNDRGFLFADGIYEVVRFYNGTPFRMDAHRKRMEKGAADMRFNRTALPEFDEICLKLQELNNLQDERSTIVYLQVTRGVAPRSHAFPPEGTPLTFYAFTKPYKSHEDEQQNGAHVITVGDDRWHNCHIKSIALLPNTLAHQKARDKGCSEALFVRDGYVQEGTHSNFFMVKDGTILTPPLSRNILAGVTRQAVFDIAEKLGLKCTETNVSEEEMFYADELFISGTTVEITPLVIVNGKKIGDGTPGPVTLQIQSEYFKMVQRNY